MLRGKTNKQIKRRQKRTNEKDLMVFPGEISMFIHLYSSTASLIPLAHIGKRGLKERMREGSRMLSIKLIELYNMPNISAMCVSTQNRRAKPNGHICKSAHNSDVTMNSFIVFFPAFFHFFTPRLLQTLGRMDLSPSGLLVKTESSEPAAMSKDKDFS